MSRTRNGLLGVLAIVLLLGPLSAQESPSLTPGQRVQVTIVSSPIKRQVATINSLSGRRITLMMPGDSLSQPGVATRQFTVPLDSMASLEVNRGFRSHGWQGAIIGAIALGAAGAGGLGKGWLYSCPRAECDVAQRIGAAVGAVGGALVGSSRSVAAASASAPRWRSEPWGG